MPKEQLNAGIIRFVLRGQTKRVSKSASPYMTVSMSRSFFSILLFILIGILLMPSCSEPPDFSDEPVISFLYFTKDTVNQGGIGGGEVVTLAIYFEDGDGGLGDAQDSLNLYLEDTRVKSTMVPEESSYRYRIPLIPEQGSSKGISGEIYVDINTGAPICCISPLIPNVCEPSDLYPIDTITFLVQIRDRAGNLSNVMETGPLYMLCN